MALALVLLAPLFFFGGPDWSSGPLYKAAWNLGHPLFFALLTLWANPWRWLSGWSLWLSVTVATTLIGIGVEVIQDSIDRQADWHDLLRNLMGAWLVLAWQPSRSCGTPPIQLSLQRTARFATAALVLLEISSVAQVAYQQYEVYRQLPRLYDLSLEHPRRYWSGALNRVSNFRGSNRPALEIALGTERYSGVSLHNLPSDWLGYDALHLELHNPSNAPLTMTLRVNDVRHDRGDNAYGDRFNTRLFLQPGINEFTIDLDEVRTAPATRSMDMNEIRRIVLFTTYLPSPETVYLTEIRLLRDATSTQPLH
ncbi:MAG: succinyl-CoA synthetase subunit beta [Marinobacter sp.]|uniref:succinyl-CoA synthetase subunit beta n=1 Tax=Marinobacter sp. TaxID=50741 RepID=UPI00299F0B59|nr:succinyl-CoA synthetase subunit beta [Marinobacter sp.]MDX1756076.1 succinyl-CoA synthetase subunit beta [Marinobacter sp.]